MKYVAIAVKRDCKEVERATFDADPAEMAKLVEIMNLLQGIGITVNVLDRDGVYPKEGE